MTFWPTRVIRSESKKVRCNPWIPLVGLKLAKYQECVSIRRQAKFRACENLINLVSLIELSYVIS